MSEERNLSQKIKSFLIEKRLITEEKYRECLQECERSHQSLVEVLYRSSDITDKNLVAALSEIFGYSTVNIGIFNISPDILSLLPKQIVKKHCMMPVTRLDKTLTVAIADPTNLAVIDDLRALSGHRLKIVLATPNQLQDAIKKYYGVSSTPGTEMTSETFEQIIEDVKTESPLIFSLNKQDRTTDLLEEARSTPIIQLVNRLLIDAIRRKASDVFIEPWERTMRIRFRIDGALEEILKIPRASVEAVVSRIKVMSRLNIAEHRIPQDGRIRVKILGREVDLRVSILPTSFGEKACLRVLDSENQAQQLEALGFSPDELAAIKRNADRPHGMILVTGPTGSGKTTTLYGVLQYLDSPEKNITTVEDPVEYQAKGINQVNVREQVGLTFPVALRSILRQDPDIILIGEIRDLITMDIAIKSALTGHLVLSTLHTNDATSAITRMINMGIEPFLIASSVLMITAQRLVRKLCPLCRTPYLPEPELLESLGVSPAEKKNFFRAKGCKQCRSTGFKGRVVISEFFELRPAILDLIMKGGSGEELRRLARERGMKTLRESGIEKVREGVTSAEEVIRVTSPEPVLQAQT